MEKLMPFTSIERAKHGTIPRHNVPLIYALYKDEDSPDWIRVLMVSIGYVIPFARNPASEPPINGCPMVI